MISHYFYKTYEDFMTTKLNPHDFDVNHLDEIEEEICFSSHQKIERAMKFKEDTKDNYGHKKPSQRREKLSFQ